MIIREMQSKLNCNGYEPLLNGKLYALKGARTVWGGDAGR
jgi:hypothetical protein